MNNIPPLAWAGIAIVVVITIILYLILVAMLSNRSRQPPKMRVIHPMAMNLRRFTEALRDPFAGERKQLGELSHLVRDLRETAQDDTQPDNNDEGKNS